MRADDIPLVFPVLGAQNLPRGARLKVRLGEVDEITLDIHGTVVERLDDPNDASDDVPLARRTMAMKRRRGRPHRHCRGCE